MSVDKQHGRFVFECECGDTFECASTDTFFEALERIKSEGWLVKRDDDDTEWLHICPACYLHPPKPRKIPLRPISQRKK